MERTVDILIEISIYSAVITAFILLFRAAFKKRISPKVQYVMWLLLVLRLMLPVTIESGFHVESLLPERPAPVVQEESIFDSPVISEFPAVNMSPVTEVAPVQPDIDTQGENAVPPVISQEIPESTVVAVPEVKEPVFNIRWRIAAFWTWVAGALVFGLWMMIVKLRFYEDMQRHTASVSPRVYAIYDECCAALKVKPITMWAVDRAISPGIAFFTYPVLLLPASMDGDEEKLRYAFLHELTHKKRHDHHMTALLTALRIIYWFNPAVHIGFSEMRADMETACDADVIAFVGKEQKRGYLTAILELFSYATRPQLGMSQASSRRMAKQRMKGAFMRERTTFLGRTAALMLAVIMLVGCFTTACQSAPVEVEEVPEETAEAIEPETTPEVKLDEVKTEVWKETYTAGGWLPVTVDAVMDIPRYVNYPVYKMEYYNFTPGKLGRIAEAVIGGVSDIKLIGAYSEEYLENGYISQEYYEKNRPMESQISPMANYSCKDVNGNEWEINTGTDRITMSAYAIESGYLIQMEEWVIAGDAYPGEPKGTTLDNIKISREEAIQEVQNVMDEIGIYNMGLSHIEKARMLDPSNKTLTEGWYLQYMRCDGDREPMPFLSAQTVFTDFENSYEPLQKERLFVFADETGIVHFTWYEPSQSVSTITDTNPPLTFAEAKDSIKKAIEEIALVTKGNYPEECTLTVNNILLSNCIVQSEFDSDAGYLIPTWAVEFSIDFGDGWVDDELLCINSIDGSQLSNSMMTEAGKRIAENYDNGLYYEQMGENEKESFRDAILRLYPLADEIAAKSFTAALGEEWFEKSEKLAETIGLRLGGAGMTGTDYLGYTVETPDEYCSNDLCRMYAAVLFAAVPNLYEMNIGNADFITYNTYLDKEHEHLLATAVGDVISREDAEKHWSGLKKPLLEEYGTSGSGIRELLSELANLSGINFASAGVVQDTPLHVSLLQPTPAPTPTPAPATGEHAWRAGKLAIEPYRDNDTSLLELSHYGITLSGNGTEQTESMRGSKVSNDVYSRDGQELLEVMRVPRGTLKLDVDLIQHSAENTKWSPDSETYGAVEYTPTWLPGHNDRVLRMTRRYERGTEDSIPYVTTIYSVQIQYNKSDVVLMFRFLNAKKIKGEWQLYQTDYDCEKWMRTFQINGAPNSIVDRVQILVGKPYKVGAYGPDAFDSSGLVHYVITQAGVYVERLENCQKYADNANWQKIEDKADLQPGDILFFYSDDFTEINHAGIYIGNSKMIDASSANDKVTERSCDTDYWQEHFAFARRVA